jgi:hypothetical protein
MGEQPIILSTSDEAAQQITVTGWVSRNGHFYGSDERTARYDGCTHRPCESCGTPTGRHEVKCPPCRKAHDDAKFAALPFEPYDGKPVALYHDDEYFFDEDDIINYAEEHEIPITDLRLVKCVPQYAEEVDPRDIYEDLLPEDGELPDYVIAAFDILNATLRNFPEKRPISWMPTSVRIELTDEFLKYAEFRTEYAEFLANG